MKHSKENLILDCPKSFLFNTDSVRAKGGVLRFHRDFFKTKDDCMNWLKGGTPDNITIRKSPFASIVEKSAISETDWKLIEPMLPMAKDLSPDQFVSFNDYLAFNVIDRDVDRFPKKVLARLSKTLVGRPKLMGHNWSLPGVGNYYKTTLKRVSVDDMISMAPNPHSKYKSILEEIEEKDGGLFWLVGTYYIPINKEEIISDIGTGLTNSSIGMIGVAYDAVTDDKGNLKYWEYILTERLQATEGSFVGVESQYGAQTRKSHKPNDDSDHSNKDGEQGEDREDNLDNPEMIESNKGVHMKIELKSIGVVKEINELVELPHVLEAIDTKVTGIVDENTDLKSQVETLTKERDDAVKFKTDFEALNEAVGELKPEQIKAAHESIEKTAKELEELKTELVKEVVQLYILNKTLEDIPEKVEKRTESLMLWDIEEIKDVKKSLKVETAEPGSSQSPEGSESKAITERKLELN